MDFNLKCENFKKDLVNLINSNDDLPISVVYYIFQSLYNEIENLYMNTVYQQKKKKEQTEEKAEESSEENN